MSDSQYSPTLYSLLFTLSSMGNILSILLNLAPIPSLHQAYASSDVRKISYSYLYMANLCNLYWILYSIKTENDDIFISSVVNYALCLLYLIVYHTITHDAGIFFMKYCVVIVALIDISYKVLSDDQLGHITLSLSLLCFVAPLETLEKVFETHDANYIDINIIGTSWASAVIWFLYGVLVNDFVIYFPQFVGVIICMAEILLYLWAKGLISKKFVQPIENVFLLIRNSIRSKDNKTLPY
jgi:solute carrier family 50 protein (sugar transporter)